MAWSFRKRIKAMPGLWLNFSKSGISTTIGAKGASINIGKRGVYGNIGVPGTGIYKREKISGKTKQTRHTPQTKVTIQDHPKNCTPQRVKITTLLQFRDVIEPATLESLMFFQAQGKDFVYIESGVVEKLRELHIDKKKGKIVNTITQTEPKQQGAPITAAIFGALFIGAMIGFTFGAKYGIISCVIAIPVFLILTTRQTKE